MKIVITAQPQFNLTLTLAVVQLLMDCSKHHYDATCRQAGEQGGFLYGWNNRMTPFEGHNPEAEGVQVSGSFRDLDLTLKLCENQSHRTEAERRLLWLYVRAVANALSHANQVRDWAQGAQLTSMMARLAGYAGEAMHLTLTRVGVLGQWQARLHHGDGAPLFDTSGHEALSASASDPATALSQLNAKCL